MTISIKNKDLENSDLIVDCLYEGGKDLTKGAGNDPFNKLLGLSNQGGFRYLKSAKGSYKYVILTSNLSEPDWPDCLDEEKGMFTYFGDNRRAGSEIHNTRKKGNLILRHIFDDLHNGMGKNIPPIFIFTNLPKTRDYEFRGLAVPGFEGISQTDDLVAIWRSKEGKRFQNYKAIFTILNVSNISRRWINDLKNDNPITNNAPKEWVDWVKNGRYTPLTSTKITKIRTKLEQLPKNKNEESILNAIIDYLYSNYKQREAQNKFEKCAAEIVKLMDRNVLNYDLTRPWRDGGFDAYGKYAIGRSENSINVEFAIEAKLYNPNKSTVGIRETSRLISRIRFRQFGILVTTSSVHNQAYEEINEDGHPIILVTGGDIARILIEKGYDNKIKVQKWLRNILS